MRRRSSAAAERKFHSDESRRAIENGELSIECNYWPEGFIDRAIQAAIGSETLNDNKSETTVSLDRKDWMWLVLLVLSANGVGPLALSLQNGERISNIDQTWQVRTKKMLNELREEIDELKISIEERGAAITQPPLLTGEE